MFNKIIGLVLCCFAFNALAVPSDDIEEALAAQEAAWNTGDINAYMQGYWQSDKMMFISNDKLSLGWQATLETYKRYYPTPESLGQLTLTPYKINMLSNTDAYVAGHWSLLFNKHLREGAFSFLFEKIEKKWVIVSDHTSEKRQARTLTNRKESRNP